MERVYFLMSAVVRPGRHVSVLPLPTQAYLLYVFFKPSEIRLRSGRKEGK